MIGSRAPVSCVNAVSRHMKPPRSTGHHGGRHAQRPEEASVARLDRDGDVRILDLGDDENRFRPDWLAEINAALDEVESAADPRALVTRAHGKIWSNGLDLDWFAAHPDE